MMAADLVDVQNARPLTSGLRQDARNPAALEARGVDHLLCLMHMLGAHRHPRVW